MLMMASVSAQVKLQFENGGGLYQKVIDVPGKNAAELYAKVNRWIIEAYTNPEKVITAKIENETIKGSGATSVKIGAGVNESLTYTFTIDVKDARVRYSMNPNRVGTYAFGTYVFKNDGTVRTNSQATNIVNSTDAHVNLLVSSLEKFLNEESKKDDW
jgi:hypothetical protein